MNPSESEAIQSPRPRRRWLWWALSLALPIALALVLRERVSWRPQLVMKLDNLDITSLALSSDGAFLAVVSWSNNQTRSPSHIVLCNAQHKEVLWQRMSSYRIVSAFIPDSHRLVIDEGIGLQMIDARSGQVGLKSESGWLGEFSTDGTQLAAAHYLSPLQIWDARQLPNGILRVKRTIRPNRGDFITNVAWSHNDHILASVQDGRSKPKVVLWNTRTWTSQSTLKHDSTVFSLSFSPNNRYLATAEYATLVVWDILTQRKLWVRRGASKDYPQIAFSPDGATLAFKHNSTLHIVKAQTGELQRLINSPHRNFTTFAFAPDGNSLYTGHHDRSVYRWRLR